MKRGAASKSRRFGFLKTENQILRAYRGFLSGGPRDYLHMIHISPQEWLGVQESEDSQFGIYDKGAFKLFFDKEALCLTKIDAAENAYPKEEDIIHFLMHLLLDLEKDDVVYFDDCDEMLAQKGFDTVKNNVFSLKYMNEPLINEAAQAKRNEGEVKKNMAMLHQIHRQIDRRKPDLFFPSYIKSKIVALTALDDKCDEEALMKMTSNFLNRLPK